MIKEVDYPSKGAMLRGLLFLPKSQSKSLALVTKAHGTLATVTMVADIYVKVFLRSSLVVLLKDHRNFGRSEGDPQQEIYPWLQYASGGNTPGACITQ
jgi:uncharacterized protein